MPNNQYNWDHFTILQNDIHNLLKGVLNTKRHVSEPVALQKAKVAYHACNDVEYKKPIALPQIQVLKEIDGWPLVTDNRTAIVSWEGIGELVAEYGVPLFLDLQVGPNMNNASEMSLWVNHKFLNYYCYS